MNELFARGSLTIGLDVTALVPIASGGIVNTQSGVLGEVVTRFPQHRYVLFCRSINRSIFDRLPESVHRVETTPENHFHQLENWRAEMPVDVLFRSYPGIEPLPIPLDRQIVYIPDIQHDYFPEFFTSEDLSYRRQAFALALGGAGAIATISEFSRATLASRAAPQSDIFLMPPALQQQHHPAGPSQLDDTEEALLPRGNYFYYPSNLWPHKNHHRVLRAFLDFAARSARKYEFVLTGDPTSWPELASSFPDARIRHLGYVSVPMVKRLYRGARALVFPSLFEGFGAPLLEAFAADTPVICSDRTSLPEVAGDAALLVDPTNVSAMAEAMERIARDGELRRDLINRGRRRLNAFEWQRSAESFVAACHRVKNRHTEMLQMPSGPSN